MYNNVEELQSRQGMFWTDHVVNEADEFHVTSLQLRHFIIDSSHVVFVDLFQWLELMS